ncbi:N-acetylmuramoyl-L-alanine amidase family protein [Paenibacillus flagellatus]|uniref:MurNAc-LAA domain-containing protein n=1 Tax=Paenibacillus flagellatus TaxID=2211139 RepID=A0A2V5K663_9BACL|nr:N-acetylmuramoyl-L-alanine amidase family protein [Paenibacillus flagellatus]PYI54841.1 hypothetical protein DLM86_09825 [Paenibacillus flagellatus]
MKYVKWLLPALLVALMLLAPVQAFAADGPIQLFLNERKLNPEVPPQIIGQGVTIVPVRIVSEGLGAKVEWFEKEQRVKVVFGGKTIEMKIGDKSATVDGKKEVLEEAPALVGDFTFVPIRFIAEQLGHTVGWDDSTRSVKMVMKAQESETVANNGGETKPDSKPSTPGNGGAAKPGTGSQPGANASEGGVPTLTKLEASGGQIVIQTSADVKATAFELSDPYRIVIDLPGTALGAFAKPGKPGQVGEMTVDHPYVEKIRYALYSDSPSTVRIVLDMKQNSDYQLTETKSAHQWAVRFDAKTYKVVIDAGHGGKDPGAKSINSRPEKDFTLPMANKVYKLLQQEPAIKTIMTRTDDTYPTLDERVALANGSNADLFVSIHGNSYNPSIRGTETYYTREDSEAFAKRMHRWLVEATGFPDRNVRESSLKVTRETTMPAVLLEVGYLSNAIDEAAMYTDEFQDRVAAAIVAGIKEQLRIGGSVAKKDAAISKQEAKSGKDEQQPSKETATGAAGASTVKVADIPAGEAPAKSGTPAK